MHPRTRLVYFNFLRVELLLKTRSQSLRHIVRLPWQRYICRSKYGCFCISPKVTYLHTKIEEGLKFFISKFASLSWRIALNLQTLFSNYRGFFVIPWKSFLKAKILRRAVCKIVSIALYCAYAPAGIVSLSLLW